MPVEDCLCPGDEYRCTLRRVKEPSSNALKQGEGERGWKATCRSLNDGNVIDVQDGVNGWFVRRGEGLGEQGVQRVSGGRKRGRRGRRRFRLRGRVGGPVPSVRSSREGCQGGEGSVGGRQRERGSQRHAKGCRGEADALVVHRGAATLGAADGRGSTGQRERQVQRLACARHQLAVLAVLAVLSPLGGGQQQGRVLGEGEQRHAAGQAGDGRRRCQGLAEGGRGSRRLGGGTDGEAGLVALLGEGEVDEGEAGGGGAEGKPSTVAQCDEGGGR
mmetsp:Transcript_2341/g.7460  ORF Transcript_2341/g.7460 Transcript_2341/m.7460 type:complete len:274 (+) Transcript_2341:300-1121(+)